jgi:hypothetical protein
MDKGRKVKAFMCGIAWQHELGETDVRLYPSAKVMLSGPKGHVFCAKECGIVEVEVKFVRWVREQNLKGEKKCRKKSGD